VPPLPPLLSEMFFDHETRPGPLLVRSSGLPLVDPFLGSAWIIASSHIDSESNVLNLTFTIYTVTQYTTVSVRHQCMSFSKVEQFNNKHISGLAPVR
jgi:hypothetical protein